MNGINHLRLFLVLICVSWASFFYMPNHIVRSLSFTGLVDPHASLPSSGQTSEALVESNVISLEIDKMSGFLERNNRSFSGRPILWVAGVDGYHQRTLNQWAKLVGEDEAINATAFQGSKGDFISPHAVGCYLAHWNLLKSLHYRPKELRPELFLVFEDDASCIPALVNATIHATSQLPNDWDIFYLGGKPSTRFLEGLQINFTDATRHSLRRDICRGAFGTGTSPLAPDGSRHLSLNQPYWKVKSSLLNTHAYVVNPQRIDRIIKVLTPNETVPIDIVLARAIEGDLLNAYMPPQTWCRGDSASRKMKQPITWEGYFYFNLTRGGHPGVADFNVWQRDMKLENCSY